MSCRPSNPPATEHATGARSGVGVECPDPPGSARSPDLPPVPWYTPSMDRINNAKLMDGRPLAKRVLERAAAKVEQIREASGVVPALATVLVGTDPASVTYTRMKRKRCEDAGMRPVRIEMPEGTTTEELTAELRRLGADKAIHGILLQHPVPKPIDKRAAFEAIMPEKDVDGVSSATLGRVILGMPAFVPCTPAGIMHLAQRIQGRNRRGPRSCYRAKPDPRAADGLHAH